MRANLLGGTRRIELAVRPVARRVVALVRADDLHIELHHHALGGIVLPRVDHELATLRLEQVVNNPLRCEELQTRDADLLLLDTQNPRQYLDCPHRIRKPEIHRRPVAEAVELHADLMRLWQPLELVAVDPAHRHLCQLTHVLQCLTHAPLASCLLLLSEVLRGPPIIKLPLPLEIALVLRREITPLVIAILLLLIDLPVLIPLVVVVAIVVVLEDAHDVMFDV